MQGLQNETIVKYLQTSPMGLCDARQRVQFLPIFCVSSRSIVASFDIQQSVKVPIIIIEKMSFVRQMKSKGHFILCCRRYYFVMVRIHPTCQSDTTETSEEMGASDYQ